MLHIIYIMIIIKKNLLRASCFIFG